MNRDQELEIFYKNLRAIGEQNAGGAAELSHKRSNNCNEDLIVDYVSKVLSPAESVIAEKKIFSCSRCTFLAMELVKMNKDLPEEASGAIKRDIAGFENWKKWFAAKNSYVIAKSYAGADLRFEGVKGWDAHIHNAKQDFRVRIGGKLYAPNACGIIEYPDMPDAMLESQEGPAVNIREFAGITND